MRPKTPLDSALPIIGYTFGGYIAVFIVGNFAVSLIFGAEAEMNWPFSFLMILLAPFVVLGGIVKATAVYTREWRRQQISKVEEPK